MSTIINLYIGQRMLTQRMRLNMSQQQLADKLNLDITVVQAYESGSQYISAPQLFLIARALSVKTSYFFADLHTS